jgi:uncharacterized protein
MTTSADIDARCEAFIREHTALNDPAHDPSHVVRVVNNARHLAQLEHARLEIVVPSAWMHDCVTLPKESPRRSEASRLAAAEATRLLAEWGCDPEWLPSIHHAIEAHSFTAGITPRTIEAKVLQDADRLDALGALGLSRSLMLGGFKRKPLYDVTDPFCETRKPDEHVAVLDHFYTKLLHLSGTMQTEAGRHEAEVRTAFLQRYLDELRRELAFS